MNKMKCSVGLLVAVAVLLVSSTFATFTLNDFDVGQEGSIPAKFIMLNNRLIEYNFGFLNPVTATRYITVLDVCMYDATSYFHPTWLPLVAQNLGPRTQAKDEPNAKIALSYAAYRCIRGMWDRPRYNTTEFAALDQIMANLSLSTAAAATDNSPIGIGNRVAPLVLTHFGTDGSNENGTDPSSDGEVFGDTTNSFPINPASPIPNRIDCANLRSINHWVPLRYSATNTSWLPGMTVNDAGTGTGPVANFAGVQAIRWKPIAIDSPLSYLPPPPPLFGTNTNDEFMTQFTRIKTYYESLDDTKKMIAEYWNERKESSMGGPMGRFQEWSCILGSQLNLDTFESIKLSLLQGVSMYDTALAVWTAKRTYDHPRPISVIQCLFGNQTLTSWQGPYQGVGPIPGTNWFPYTQRGANSPPFPGYVSGHASFSAATAEIFKFFNNNNDTLDWQYIYRAGTSLMEPRRVAGDPNFVAGLTDVPNAGPATRGYVPAQDVVLHWNTFSDAANQCGQGRSFAGVHIESDWIFGNQLGRKVAQTVIQKLGCAFRGKACCAPQLV